MGYVVQSRYGIPFSTPAALPSAPHCLHSGLARGSTAPAPNPLPSSPTAINTHDYTTALLSCLDREVKRGLLHLANRGLLPPRADITGALTGQSNVLHTQAVHLLPHEERFIASPSVPDAAREYGLYSRVGARKYKATHGPQDAAVRTSCGLAGGSGNAVPGVSSQQTSCDSGSSTGSVDEDMAQAVDSRNARGNAAHPQRTAARPPSGPSALHARGPRKTADRAVVKQLVADAEAGGDVAAVAPGEESIQTFGTPAEPQAGAETSGSSEDGLLAAGSAMMVSAMSIPTGDDTRGLREGVDGLGPPDTHLVLEPDSHARVDGGDAGPATAVRDEEARQYELLMDDLSVHSVIIRKGQVLDTTPEYESFRRTCGDAWPAVAGVLLQLEAICVQYAVPLATVAGAAVLQLGQEAAGAVAACTGGQDPPPLAVERLLGCIENIQEVAEVLQRPGQRFRGPNGTAAAVVLIQAFMRGLHARRVRLAAAFRP